MSIEHLFNYTFLFNSIFESIYFVIEHYDFFALNGFNSSCPQLTLLKRKPLKAYDVEISFGCQSGEYMNF
jgi:hypothetical protein